ncbi:hypothetical protein, partial [Ralstonia pickettii]|uniref:hypothetical protein n=2 Tax=Ralstonia pickettii TaxID=329 RepID=UPI002D78100B
HIGDKKMSFFPQLNDSVFLLKDTTIWGNKQKESIAFNYNRKIFIAYSFDDRLTFMKYEGEKAIEIIDEVLDYFAIVLSEADSVSYIHRNLPQGEKL